MGRGLARPSGRAPGSAKKTMATISTTTFERIDPPTTSDARAGENRVIRLVHVTTAERARSIVIEGLVPGNQERCNYDCNRWMPLDGVYLTQSRDQILGYRRAHALEDAGVVVVEADPALLLPDEDVIDHLLETSTAAVMGIDQAGLRRRHEDDGIPASGDPFWERVRDAFVATCGPRSASPLREDDLETLVDWWADFEFFGEGGDVAPFEWAALKGAKPSQKSKRHPGPIGFRGPVRIVGVAIAECGLRTDLIAPFRGCGLVDAALDQGDWWNRTGSDEDRPVCSTHGTVSGEND